MKKKDFKKMIEYVVSLFPQAVAQNDPSAPPRAFFESIYNDERPSTPNPVLKWFDRVMVELSRTDTRVAKYYPKRSRKFEHLIPKKREFVSVHENPSKGTALTVNKSLFPYFVGSVSSRRLVGFNLTETVAMETGFRSHTEDLSHTMWVLTGLIGLLRDEGFTPKDSDFFNKLVSITLTLIYSAGG